MAQKINTLSAVELKSLPAGKHFDGGGLYLLVKPLKSGGLSRYWCMKFRFGGVEDVLRFGVFPEVGLKEARHRRDEARALLRDGINPKAHKQAKQEAHRRATSALFPAVAADWLEFKERGWAPESARKARYVLDTYLIPPLRRQSVSTLTTKQALDVLQACAEKAPALAAKARQYIAGIVDFAIRQGLREDGKVLMLRGALPKYEKGHIPAATDLKDLEAVVKAIAEYDSEVTRAALQFSMLTAQRPGNVVSARWEHIDLESAEWSIPPDEMKKRHAHVVPLPRQAVEILEAMKQYTAGQTYVFPPLARQKSKHLARDTLSKALRDMGFQGRHSTHGFRGMLRTVARERLGVDVDVLEAQLAHSKKGDVQKAYDRTQFLEQRREVMQAWADYLDQVREGKAAKVLPFRRKAA